MANTKLILILISLLVVVLASGCVENGTSPEGDTALQDESGIAVCPESCDDSADYTRDHCSADTNYNCEHELIPNICGNQICEPDVNENTFTCPQDCQRKTCIYEEQCDDNNPCTKDTCTQGLCYSVLRDAPCRTGGVTGTEGVGIELTEASICTDTEGNDNLIGTIKNNDVDNFGAITVNAMLYTYEKASFIGEKTVNAYANVLGPEQESWFKIPLAEYGNHAVQEYEINLGYLKTAKPATDLEIIDFEYDPHPVTGQKTKHPDGYYYFTGNVKNYGEMTVKNIMVYNADNCITPITPGKTTLMQSMLASFWDKTLTPANLTVYGAPV